MKMRMVYLLIFGRYDVFDKLDTKKVEAREKIATTVNRYS